MLVNRSDMGQQGSEEDFVIASLTAKQRQVLDLLIEHKTSKEIARRLHISPYTVDQRINFAKDKLGARTRGEAARAYRELIEACGRSAYGNSGIGIAGVVGDGPGGAQLPLPESAPPEPARNGGVSAPEADFSVVPESFDGRFGTLVRLGAIFVIAVMLVLVVLGGLAIYTQLSLLLGAGLP
jgi:DNA-binding CsgD family transcriptional regulator